MTYNHIENLPDVLNYTTGYAVYNIFPDFEKSLFLIKANAFKIVIINTDARTSRAIMD